MVKTKVICRGKNFFEKSYELKNKYGISIQTPTIAIPKKYKEYFQKDSLLSNPITEIVFEIRQERSIKKLKYLRRTPNFGDFINNKLRGNKNKINIFIVAWGKKGYSKEDFLNISFSILDSLNYEKVVNDNFIVPPFTYLLKNISYLNDGYKFVDNCIFPLVEKLEEIIPKPENIFGYVPLYFFESEWLRELMNKYFRLGITKYLLDFGGKNVDTLKNRIFILLEFKEKVEKEYGEKTSIIYYAFNTFRGQFRKRDETPARDFLSLFTGFDILGNYARREVPPEVLKNIDRSLQEFVNDRYTYRRTHEIEENKIKKINIKRMLKETKNLKKELKNNNTFLTLLKNKPREVKNIVDQIIHQDKIDRKYSNLI